MMNRTVFRPVCGVSPLALLLAALVAAPASAQTYSWNNFAGTAGGGTVNWSDTNNWTSPPTFGQNAILSFGSSGLQTAGSYLSTNDGDNTVNGLVFSTDGNPQGAFNGTPLVLNAGASSGSVIRLSTSTTGAAPSIVQNGSGSVVIQAGTGGVLAIEGPNPLTIGGTGIGLLQINAPITAGATSGANSGLLINFAPSAVGSYFTGASVALAGANTFTGDVTLQNGNLALGSNTALGAATNRLIINSPSGGSSNSVRFTAGTTIANPVVLNSTMNFTGFDGATATWTGAWSGAAGLTIQPIFAMSFNIQGTAAFAGPMVARPAGLGGTGNLTVNVGSSATTTGSLATTDVQLFPGTTFNVTNAVANATRLATGTNVSMFRATFALLANSNAGINAAETVASLNNTGMATILAAPASGTVTGATLTFGSWTRNVNSTALFVAPNLGSAPGANVGNIVFTTNPGGATPGSTTPGTQNLAVLPYAYANLVPTLTTNAVTSLVRYDTGTGRIVPLNTSTEYASNQTLATGTGTAGLNYRLAGANSGGVAALSGPVSLNGLVLETNMASPAPPVGVALFGGSTLTLTGPVLSTFSGTGFATGTGTYLPQQIAVGGLAFGANTAYFHTQADLWVSSPINGSGGLVKSGDNSSNQANLYLLAANTFTGGLTINGGGVFFTADANLGATGGSILMNTGALGGLTLTQNPYYDAAPSPNVTVNRPLTLGAANGALGVTNTNNTLTYSGPITGAGGLAKSGAGMVVLNNATNSFSGDIVLGAGTLSPTSDAVLGAPSNRVIMSGGTFMPGSGYTSTNRDFIFTAGTQTPTILTNNADFTINGQLVSTQTGGSGPGLTKIGNGTLTLTAANTLGSGGANNQLTIGDTGIRPAAPQQAQIGGGIRLAGPNGSLALVGGLNNAGTTLLGYTINDSAFLTLDNSAGVNTDRVGTAPVALNGGAFNMIGNAAANSSELVGTLATGSKATITLTQPTSAGGQVTTLNATGLNSGGGTIFVRGTNLGAATGDRTKFLVTPADTTALPLVSGIVVGGFAAASDAATGPTDFLAATTVSNPAPNVNQYSLAPLTTYGTLASPGSGITADQAGSVFTLSGQTDLNALRIGAGGGLDLNGTTLVLGTTTLNARAGAILAAGGANAGIVGGTIDFGAGGQPVRIVTTNDLTIGTAGNPTAILGSNPATNSTTTSTLIKTGPGTLTLFGTAATTLSATATFSGSVLVGEGRLVLGNATALGRSTLNSTTVAPVPNVFPSPTIMKGATLDVSPLSATPVRINTVSGAGTLALGDTQVYTGVSSSNITGNITGSANSKFVVGLPQSDIPFNTYGGGGPALTGDNSGFLGQWQVLRGTLNFSSNLSFGTGTSAIQFSDTSTNGSTGSVSLRIDAGLTVPFSRDVTVPAGGFALPTFLVGNSSNVSMTGNVSLGKAAAVVGTTSGSTTSITGMFTFAGSISGAGQLILANAGLSGSAGNVTIAGANPNWSGGVLMTGGGQTSTINSILAIGSDTSLGTGTLTLGQFSGLLRADNGTRTLANAIDVTNTTPTAAFTTTFGTTGVNDIVFNGNVRGVLYQQFNMMPPSVPATPFIHTLNLNDISRGTTTFAGTIGNGAAFSFGITKNGPGLVAFNGNNSYTGDTLVNAGTVQLGNPNALGFGGRQGMTSVVGVATVNTGAVLDLNGQQNVNKPIILIGGSLVNNGTAPAIVAGGTVSSLTMTASGNPNGIVPNVTLNGGGGAGATAVASLGLQPASFTFAPLTQGGTGYTSAPTVNITGGGGTGATAAATLGVTAQTFTITNGGSGYTTAPSVTISASGTSGASAATATATIANGVVTSISITSPGSGYLFAPTITFATAPAGGTTATGVGNATNFQVGSVVLTNPGGGFSTAPTFAFTGGGGNGAAVTTNATNFAMGLQITNPGSGYTSAPTVSFSAGSATATANLSGVTLSAPSNLGGTGPLTINAPIAGAGSLNKIGTGLTTLSGANTYSGGTVVSAGILNVTNTTGSGTGTGSVAVNPGGLLQGTGSVTAAGDVSVNGGAIKGGSSPGTLTITSGNLNLNANSTYVIDLRTAGGFTAGAANSGASGTGGPDNSRVTVAAGAFNFNTPASTTIKLTGDASLFTAGQQYSFVVGSGTSVAGLGAPISGTGAAPGQFDLSGFSNVFANSQFSLESTGNQVFLNFTPVPEPTGIVLSGVAAGLAAFIRRRRKCGVDGVASETIGGPTDPF